MSPDIVSDVPSLHAVRVIIIACISFFTTGVMFTLIFSPPIFWNTNENGAQRYPSLKKKWASERHKEESDQLLYNHKDVFENFDQDIEDVLINHSNIFIE